MGAKEGAGHGDESESELADLPACAAVRGDHQSGIAVSERESKVRDSFPFLIAAFVFLMDQYKQLGIVPPEEEPNEDRNEGDETAEVASEADGETSAGSEKKPILHRGEAILSLNAVTNFECSLTQLNYSQETSDALSSSLNSVFGRVKASSLILHTSFMQITAYFAQQEVQNLRGPLDKETEHLLKVLSMALMKALYLLGARGVFDVEFRRRWALPSWRR